MRKARQRFETLDSLRGICALLVCLYHFKAVGPLTENGLVEASWVFVDFFFVLSGFVIAHSYSGRLDAGMPLLTFAGLRFMRLYPLHIAMLLLFLLAETAGSFVFPGTMQREPFSGPMAIEAFGLNLLLLHSFGIQEGLSWNHPSWSIAVEFWTYLLFALLITTVSRLTLLFTVCAVVASAAGLFYVTDRGINVTWDFGMIRCIYGFGLGVIGHQLWQRIGTPLDHFGFTRRSMLEISWIAILLLSILLFSAGRISIVLPPLFLITILLFSGDGGLVSQALRRPAALFLGSISYAIYMVHTFIQARFEDGVRLLASMGGPSLLTPTNKGLALVGSNALNGTIVTLLMLSLVIVASALAYRWIEQPGIRLGRKLIN